MRVHAEGASLVPMLLWLSCMLANPTNLTDVHVPASWHCVVLLSTRLHACSVCGPYVRHALQFVVHM
jgi:hypothetical protein